MKKFLLPLALSLYCFTSFSQESELQTKLKKVQELLTTVEANKITYKQELKTITPGYYDYTVTEINGKGQEDETTYSFALADIQKSSVRSFTKKDVIMIELIVTGKQKLIKRSTDQGNKIAYLADFVMYGLNADNGRDIESAVEEAIPDAESLEKNTLAISTYDEHLNWLNNHVGNVSLPKKEIDQHLKLDPKKKGFMILEQSSGSKRAVYEFNLAHLHANSVNYDISGEEFLIGVDTQKGEPAIKYFLDGELKGYINHLEFYASSLSNGKQLYRVLKQGIPLAEEYYSDNASKFNSVSEAQNSLNKILAHIDSENRVTSQNIGFQNNLTNLQIIESEDGKSEEHLYLFNFADISKNGLPVKEKKSRLFLVVNALKGKPYIGHQQNGEIENYEDELFIYLNSYDEALVAREAINFLIDHYGALEKEKDAVAGINLEKALDQLKNTVQNISTSDYTIEQFFEILETEENSLRFTQIEANSKKNMEAVYEFSAADLNKQRLNVEVSGKKVWAEIGTKSGDKVVKVYEDGEVQNYINEINIEAPTIENAKQLVHIFRQLAESQ